MRFFRFLVLFLSPLLLWTAAGCGGGGLGGTEGKLTGQWVAEKLNAKGDRIMMTFNSDSAAVTTDGSSGSTKNVVITAIRPAGDSVGVDSGIYAISGGKISFQLASLTSFESPFTLTATSLTLGTEIYTKSGGALGGPSLGGQIIVSQAAADQSVTTSSLKVKSSVPPFVPGQLLVFNPKATDGSDSQSGLSVQGGTSSGEERPSYRVVNIKLDDDLSALGVAVTPPASIFEHANHVLARRDLLRKKTFEEYQKCKPNCALNRILRTQSLSEPTDISYKEQWNLEAMDVTDSWGIATPVKEVVVAVIDTGIVEHPDFKDSTGYSRILKKADGSFWGYDFVHNKSVAEDPADSIEDLDLDTTAGPDPDPTDPGDKNSALGLPGGSSWHGTHIAGIICAAIDNAVGIAGITNKCKILPLRAMGFEGNGTLVDVAEAIRYAAKLPNVAECGAFTEDDADNGSYAYSTASCTIDPARPKANIINLSLGAPMKSDEAKILNEAIDAAYAAGVLVVAASGNEAKGPGWCIDDETGNYYSNPACAFYPAANSNVISVGAVVANLKFASGYSNFGGAPANTQFLAAPGGSGSQAILSTVNTSVLGGYAELMGTSQAAAHVSGVAAQAWAEIASAPALPAAQPARDIQIRDWVKTALSASAVDLGTAGRDVYFGYGLVNTCGAVVKARQLAALSAPAAATAVQLSSTKVNFGPLATSHTSIVYGCGGSPLSVVNATKTSGTGWLDVKVLGLTTPAQLVLTVNRAGLAAGNYAAAVTVNTASAGSKIINVSMRVGTASIAGGGESGTDDDLRKQIEGTLGGEVTKENTIDLGEVILLLVDAETGDTKWHTKTDFSADYNFQFGGFTPGKYYIVAGVDENLDGIICNSAETEPCFSYPSLADPEPFDVETSTRKTDVVLNYSP